MSAAVRQLVDDHLASVERMARLTFIGAPEELDRALDRLVSHPLAPSGIQDFLGVSTSACFGANYPIADQPVIFAAAPP
jgi:hypothetical protein